MNTVMNAAVASKKVFDTPKGRTLSFKKTDKVSLPGIICVWLTPNAANSFTSREAAEKECLYYDPKSSTELKHAVSMQMDLVAAFTEEEHAHFWWRYALVEYQQGWVVQILFGSHHDMSASDLLGDSSIDDECSE